MNVSLLNVFMSLFNVVVNSIKDCSSFYHEYWQILKEHSKIVDVLHQLFYLFIPDTLSHVDFLIIL